MPNTSGKKLKFYFLLDGTAPFGDLYIGKNKVGTI